MSTNAGPFELASNYLRMRPDASVEVMPVDDTFWPRLMSGQMGDFKNEFLICHLSFTEDWPTWEIHPNGDEIVFLVSGTAEFYLESPEGEVSSLVLNQPGHYVFVPQGHWHTAKISQPTSMVFFTPGEGTENRPL